jgi:hypothetical protein
MNIVVRRTSQEIRTMTQAAAAWQPVPVYLAEAGDQDFVRDAGLSPPGVPYVPTDDDVEAVLAEFDGDPKRAIRALLEDIGALAEDRRKNVSYGFIYGHLEVVK